MKNKTLFLLFCIFICQMAGVAGSAFTFREIPTWYAGLVKPAFQPPNWLFGPAWTTLYTLMGISIFLIFKKLEDKKLKKKKRQEIKSLIILFFVHLVVNAGWSIIFFGLHELLLSFATIIVLWMLIAILILRFHNVDKVASWLLVPYLFWVSFASALNYSIWRLNL